jgi:hypothetical protein
MEIVDDMSCNDLQLVVGESPDVIEKRRSLERDIERLQHAREVLEAHSGQTVPLDAF